MNGSSYQISVAKQINAVAAIFASCGVKLLIPITTGFDGGNFPVGTNTPAQYAAMCAWLVEQCPGLYWEILNEPDYSGTTPAVYTEVVQAAYPAMKVADPTCMVIAGVLSDIFSGGQTYWSTCYADGIKGYYDAISIHTYTNNGGQIYGPGYDPGNDLLPYLVEFKNILVSNGDASTPLWITEFGWDTNSFSLWQQATYTYLWFSEIQNQGIDVAICYKLIDDPGDGDGIVLDTYLPKPAWYAMRGLVTGVQQPHFVKNGNVRARLNL